MTILDQIPNKRALALALFPQGTLYDASGRMHVGDWDGNPGQSCVVWLDQGRLHDFNGRVSGDLVDVIMHRGNFGPREAATWLRDNNWTDPDYRPEPTAPVPVELIDLPAAPARTPLPEPGSNGAVYVYRWPDGSIAMLVRRWPGRDGKKVIRRQRWAAGEWMARTVDQGGRPAQWWSWFEREWVWGRTDDARLPLYGLGELLRQPDAEVLIVEGEKACKAGYIRWPDMVTICPPGGSNPAPGTDWTPLTGRSVGILGDADAAGRVFAVTVADRCQRAGATVRAVLNPQVVYETLGGVGTVPASWDVADEVV